MKNVTHTTSLPDVIEPPAFPLARRKYLAEKIKPYVMDEAAKDILCPVPSELVCEDVTDAVESVSNECQANEEAAEEVMEAKRKAPVCGYCKETGHRNQIRRGTPLYPKRKADFEDM